MDANLNLIHQLHFKQVSWSEKSAQKMTPLLYYITEKHSSAFEDTLDELQNLGSHHSEKLFEQLENKCNNLVVSWQNKISALGLKPLGLWQALFYIDAGSEKPPFGVWNLSTNKITFLKQDELKGLDIKKA